MTEISLTELTSRLITLLQKEGIKARPGERAWYNPSELLEKDKDKTATDKLMDYYTGELIEIEGEWDSLDPPIIAEELTAEFFSAVKEYLSDKKYTRVYVDAKDLQIKVREISKIKCKIGITLY